MFRNLFLLYKNTIHKSLGSTVCSRLLVFVFMYLSIGNVNAQDNGFDYFNYEDEPYLREREYQRNESDFYNGGYKKNNHTKSDFLFLNNNDDAIDNPNRDGNEELHESIRTTPEIKNYEPEISGNSIDLPDVPDVSISNPFLLVLLLLIGIVLYAKLK